MKMNGDKNCSIVYKETVCPVRVATGSRQLGIQASTLSLIPKK
ncbi:MAG: hypothetical protein ABFS56_32645 [Pseudomonadota bacterium]